MRNHVLARTLVLVALLPTTAPAGAAGPRPAPLSEPASPGIAGSYALSGISRDESTYGGEVEISELGRSLYWIEWRDSDSSYTGKGALVGDTLFAVWGSQAAGCSAVFFQLGDDGVLDGFWFPAQNRDAGRGRITARPHDPRSGGLEGAYSVEAEELEGSGFPPDLRVTALGDGYFAFRWDGDEGRRGIGYLDVDQIQVIVSPDRGEGQCGQSEMTVGDDGALEGTWMMNDEKFRTPGREKMVRRP